MTWLFILILIYLISCAIHIIMCYNEHKKRIYTIGDLFDNFETYQFIPIINTVSLIVLVLLILIIKIGEILRLHILWNKFRNIKLK